MHKDTGWRDGDSAWSASRHTHEEEIEFFLTRAGVRCPEHRILMQFVCDEYACLACQEAEYARKPPEYHDWWIDHSGIWHDRATDPPGGRVDITTRGDFVASPLTAMRR